jgi:hypothetical protein
MKLAAAALVLLMASPIPASAAELGVVTQFDDVLMYQIYASKRGEATSLIANSTVRGRLGDIDPELREKLPFGGDMVLFFAEGGDLLAWSDKSTVIELGYWELIGSSGFNELCLRFGSFGLISLCSSPEIAASDWLIETTPGNPFALVAGAAVPAALGATDLDLTAIAARVP